MRHVLVYSSVSGNTKAVAEAIHPVMPPGTGIYPVQGAPDPDDFDVLVLGFWTHRGGPDPIMARYMERVRGKTVAIFGTLAAYPDSEHAQKVMAAAKASLAGNMILGCFLCQGRLTEKRLVQRMAQPLDDPSAPADPSHPMTVERRARLMEAAKHPDEQDFAAARDTFVGFLGQFQA